MDPHSGGRLGTLTVVTIFLSMLVSVSIGAIMCLLIQPGDQLVEGTKEWNSTSVISYTDVLTDFLRLVVI